MQSDISYVLQKICNVSKDHQIVVLNPLPSKPNELSVIVAANLTINIIIRPLKNKYIEGDF
jgi:hypothetical protein